MSLVKRKAIKVGLVIASLLVIKTYVSYDKNINPYLKKIGVMDTNIENGMKAMRELAEGYKNSQYDDTETIVPSSSTDSNSRLTGEILLSWKQSHKDGLLYSYSDDRLDFDGTGLGDGKDITKLALVKINTYENLTSLLGNGVKAYSIIKGNNKYSNYKLALISYDNSLENLELDNIDLTESQDSTDGITINDNLVYVEQGLVDGVSRIEYTDGNEKIYLSYTFDIFGDEDKLKDLPNNFSLDLINKYNGESYSDKLESIAYKFDNSKFLTDNKDYVQLSLTISLIFDPEYLNTLLENNPINFKSIGYAQSSFSDLFVFRVNNKFDINLK
jgi:hypothetical protein